MRRLVPGLLALAAYASGCQWARVRYVDGAAQRAERLVCEVRVNDLVCSEYHSANKADGVQVVPANSAERVDM